MSEACTSILLADANPDFRERLVNQLLMSGAEQVGVATEAGELAEALRGSEYDLIVLSYPIFIDHRAKLALRRYRHAHAGAIIVLLEDDGRELTVRTLMSIDAQVCVLRSSAGRMLKRIVSS